VMRATRGSNKSRRMGFAVHGQRDDGDDDDDDDDDAAGKMEAC